jgi:hypothetical protein
MEKELPGEKQALVDSVRVVEAPEAVEKMIVWAVVVEKSLVVGSMGVCTEVQSYETVLALMVLAQE